MTLRDAINKLLGRQPASANTAKQRLQLVLAHDRSDLNPELLQQMRREILEVVSRYVEIDLEEVDMSLETEDRVTALVANLPIKRARALPVQAMEDQALADQAPADRAIPNKTPEGSEESTDFTAKISSSTSV